jgi:outer membrane protein assembly factor BamB
MRNRGNLVLRATALLLIAVAVACSGTHAEVDGCGHDLSSFHSTVFAVNAATGQIVWTRDDLPVGADGLTRLADGKVRLAMTNRQLLLDALSGRTVEEQGPSTYVISIPPPGSDPTPPGANSPPVTDGSNVYLVIGGALVARDRASQTQKWTVPLDRHGGTSPPMPFKDLVIISNSDTTPTCV